MSNEIALVEGEAKIPKTYDGKSLKFSFMDRVLVAAFSTVVAFCLVAGFLLGVYEDLNGIYKELAVSTIALACLLCPLFLKVLRALIANQSSPKQGEDDDRKGRVPHWWSYAACAVIFACWTPILLAGYPGFFTYDAGLGWLMQWSQIESGVLNAHHPVIHTLFLEYTVKAGMYAFGSFNAGVCFSVLVQAAVVCAVFAYVLRWLASEGVGRVGFLLAACYYALDPVIGVFAFCTTKDVFFAATIVSLCVLLWRMTKQELSGGGYFLLFTLAFLMCCLRSNGMIAAVLLLLIVPVLTCGRRRLRFLTSFGGGLLAAVLFLGPISSLLLQVEESPIGGWNSLGVPMQQLARCSVDERVSQEDKEEILEAFPNLEYRDNLSDVARSSMIEKGEETLPYYLEYGMKYPEVYLDAMLLHTYDAWSPFAVLDCYAGDEGANTLAISAQEPAEADSKIPWLKGVLAWISYSREAATMPIVGMIISISLYLFVMLFCLVRAILARDKSSLILLLPLALLSLTNLLGPCSLIRYYLYLFFGLPCMLLTMRREIGSEGAPSSILRAEAEDALHQSAERGTAFS